DGKLHLLSKDQVTEVVREKSLMPKVEASPADLRYLVAYLARLTVDPNGRTALPPDRESGIPFSDVAQPKAGAWPTYHGNVSGNRFSPLDQINAGNVEKLSPAWMFSIAGAPRALEMTPVVVDGVMYVTSVNEAFALDARN